MVMMTMIVMMTMTMMMTYDDEEEEEEEEEDANRIRWLLQVNLTSRSDIIHLNMVSLVTSQGTTTPKWVPW
jgi:hypothetical protein